MYIKTKLASAVKASLLLSVACTTLATVQVSAQENQDGEAAIEKIAVTGSRIKSAELASASPLQIIDAGDIQASGVANIQDLLLENPAFGTFKARHRVIPRLWHMAAAVLAMTCIGLSVSWQRAGRVPA